MRVFVASLLFGMALVARAVTPPADDPVRVFADSMAKAMVDKKYFVLTDNLAPAMIAAHGKEKLVAPLEGIRDRFGDILSYEFKYSSVGTEMAGSQRIRTATLWYAAKTSKRGTGAFLQLTVARENERFYLARYFVMEFLGNNVPPQLQ